MPSSRKRVRRFLAAPSIHETVPANELLSRRWLPEDKGTVDLRVQDLTELLHSERAARRCAAVHSRKAAEAVQVAQRNKDAFLRERAECLKRGTAVAELHTENATLRETVSELSSKISDPPGSHERWQELRQSNASLAAQLDSLQTSLAQAEEQIRTQADTIEHQAGLLREAHKYAEPLGRLAASVPDLRRLVEERGRKIRELTAERDRERENATRLAKKLDAARPDILREPDLRKIAEDLLPQFLATFSESLRGQK